MSATPLKTALIVGSTRPNRFVDRILPWLTETLSADPRIDLTILDLKDHPLPFYNEPAPAMRIKGEWSEPAAEAWRRKIGAHDAFIATVAEYNHGPTAVLKNALDNAYYEWNRKPLAFVGYGSMGGVRAVEQLRQISVELQMAPLRHEVNLVRDSFVGILTGKTPADFPYLGEAMTALVDNLVWWGEALRAQRAKTV